MSCGGDRFIEQPKDFQPGDDPGLVSGLTFSHTEVGGDRDDGADLAGRSRFGGSSS